MNCFEYPNNEKNILLRIENYFILRFLDVCYVIKKIVEIINAEILNKNIFAEFLKQKEFNNVKNETKETELIF